MQEYFDAFEDMYRAYMPVVFRFIYSFTMCRETSQDLTHDAFLKAYENNACNTDRGFCSNKLMAITRNIVYDHFRRANRHREKMNMIVSIEKAKRQDALSRDLADRYIRGEIISSVHDVIESFTEWERSIFSSRINKEAKRSEICRQYGISLYKIRQIEAKISARIKQRLRKFDLDI